MGSELSEPIITEAQVDALLARWSPTEDRHGANISNKDRLVHVGQSFDEEWIWTDSLRYSLMKAAGLPVPKEERDE